MIPNSQQPTSRKAVSPLRVVAASAAAVLLLGSSFSAVRGGSLAGYGGGGGGGDDDDGGLSGGAVAGIVLGAGAVGYLVVTGMKKEKEEEGAPSSKAASSRRVASVRVMPQNVRLERGAAQGFQVQARYAGEDRWQNVTDNPSASLKIAGSAGRVIAVDGAKNVFTAPIDAKGGPASVKLLGAFAGAEASTLVAVQ